MKACLLTGALTLALVLPAFAVDAPPTDVVVINHGEVANAFAKGLPMLVNSSYKIQTGRRVTAGVVEWHEHDTDIFWVTEGSASIVTGGTMENPKTSATGEVRADRIKGGVTHQLTKGDIMVIPSGVPHWFNEVSGTFLYFVVKVTK